MKKHTVKIDLTELIKGREILCYSENMKTPDEYGEDQFHQQTPTHIIMDSLIPEVSIFDANMNVNLGLTCTSLVIQTVCGHCGETNLYPDYIWLKEPVAKHTTTQEEEK